MRHKILGTVGLILVWTLAVTAMVFAEAFWFAHPSVALGDPAAIKDHLVQTLSDAAVDHRVGSAALVLVQEGKVVAEHGFGVANAETQAPVKTDQTLFQLASVSKAVTGWGVMKPDTKRITLRFNQGAARQRLPRTRRYATSLVS